MTKTCRPHIAVCSRLGGLLIALIICPMASAQVNLNEMIPDFLVAVQSPSRPNIIFVMSDDVPKEFISCYGSYLSEICQTPHIDSIARDGMRFENMFTVQSLCSPTRASLITGQYPHHHQVTGLGQEINPESPWVSEALQKAGYQTAIVGKWHLASRPKGFDYFALQHGQGDYFDPVYYTPEPIQKKGYTVEQTHKLAMEWLDQRDTSKPFCLFIWHKTPHGGALPHCVPEQYRELYNDMVLPEPPTLHEDVSRTGSRIKRDFAWQLTEGRHNFSELPLINKQLKETYSSEDERRSDTYQLFVKGVFRQIKTLDDEMGKLLVYLKTKNLEDNTMLVYTADQGYMLGQHGGMAEKRPSFEESLHMPFIAKYPALVDKESVNEDLLTCLDVPATFLDLAGLPPDPEMQGRSFMPLLGGETPPDWRKAFFFQHFGAKLTHYGIRTDRYKHYTYVLDDPEEEFYDLRTNPLEIQNQINDVEYGPQIHECRETTARLMDELNITKEMTERQSYIEWKEPQESYEW